jgi:hypothetical protein
VDQLSAARSLTHTPQLKANKAPATVGRIACFWFLMLIFLSPFKSYLTLSLKFTSQLLSLLVSDLADVQFCQFCGDNIVRIFVAGFLPFALNLSFSGFTALITVL